MPSRKKSKGKERKPVGPPRYNWRQHFTGMKEQCSHGSSSFFPLQKNIEQYMDTFESFVQKNLRDGDCTPGFYATKDAKEKHPGTWGDDSYRKTLVDMFVLMGIDHVLHGQPKNLLVAKDLAGVIVLIEMYGDDTTTTPHVLAKHRDLEGDAEREMIKFYHKRSSCACLNDKYAWSKKQPKLGVCHHCHQKKKRCTLLLCGNCLVGQYCSPKCQKAAWPSHKPSCERYASN